MAKKNMPRVRGTWMRGADGGLYFIPDKALKAYRVPERLARPALKGVDTEESLARYARLRIPPNIRTIRAIRGPVGRRDLGAGPAAIVPPAAQLRGLRQTRLAK
jgi:hypothetical protein